MPCVPSKKESLTPLSRPIHNLFGSKVFFFRSSSTLYLTRIYQKTLNYAALVVLKIDKKNKKKLFVQAGQWIQTPGLKIFFLFSESLVNLPFSELKTTDANTFKSILKSFSVQS